jgi:hypothetical protein
MFIGLYCSNRRTAGRFPAQRARNAAFVLGAPPTLLAAAQTKAGFYCTDQEHPADGSNIIGS